MRSGEPSGEADASGADAGPSMGLRLFCLALMIPACGINGALIALAIPALAPFGIPALFIAALIGGVLGVLPAKWLAAKIHDGLKE